jgi:hypothetical protein
MPRDHLRLMADVLLDVRKERGPLVGIAPLPGAPLIRHALDALESLRKSQKARRRLEDLLEQVEQDFLREAPGQGLDRVAKRVTQLPFHNLDSFRRALEALRDRLAWELAQIPNLGPGEQARVLALYPNCLRRRLLADPEFCPIVLALSALRVEKDLERLLERVDALYRALNRLIGLPEDLVAWPVETLDAQAVRELRADLLLPRYRLVPYTGKAFRQTLEDRPARAIAGSPALAGRQVKTPGVYEGGRPWIPRRSMPPRSPTGGRCLALGAFRNKRGLASQVH